MSTIHSADNYFMVNGEYKFDPTKISLAHRACFAGFIETIGLGSEMGPGIGLKVAIMSGIPGSGKSFHAAKLASEGYVVVDNTNLSAWEISPYMLAAESAGATVTIFRVKCDASKAFARNTHGVPQAAHERMASAFAKRDVLPWWNVVEIEN